MTMLASFEGYLMIYKDTQLAWTTKLPSVPVFISRAEFQRTKGFIISFSDNGHLSVNYLGTDRMSSMELGKLHQNEQQVDYV